MTEHNGPSKPRSAAADTGQLVVPPERDELAALGYDNAAEIARGGFGIVYRAEQPALHRDVAVKVMLAPVYDPKVRARFTRECLAMGMLSDHPGIVTVFDAGFTASGRPYLVMDLMTGGALAQRLRGQGAMDWASVLDIGVTIAGALESAHRAGIIHRDVKPENILLSEYGEPKLGDFGIARLQGGTETQTGTLTASIAHAAPELLSGGPPSVRSDLYALGSTLFALLRGTAAFVHPTDESIVPALARITTQPVPDLRPEGVPDAVCAVVEQLMAKAARDRFDSAEAAGRALQEVQAALGLPVTPLHLAEGSATSPPTTRPDTRTRVVRQRVRRAAPRTRPRRRALRRPAMALAALALVAVIAVAAAVARTTGAPPTTADGDQPGSAEPLDTAAVLQQLSDIRGVSVTAPVEARRLPPDTYEPAVRAWAVARREDRLADHGRVLAALHLVPPGTDLVALTQDLYAEQFLGFYDPATTIIALRQDTPTPTPLERSILADEAASALLDQAFATASATTAIADGDARRAFQAVVQGDAALAASAWVERFLTNQERADREAALSAQPDRVGRSVPDAVRAELVFPFVAGEQLVRAVFEQGGVGAMDALYTRPPQTTEQVLHPEAYLQQEAARPAAVAGDPGPGWEPLVTRTFGEFDLRQLVGVLGPQQQRIAGTGWGGGALQAWTSGERTAVGIALTFDSRRDAREACAALPEAYARLSGGTAQTAPPDGADLPEGATVVTSSADAMVLTCTATDVDLAVAPDLATAAGVHGR